MTKICECGHKKTEHIDGHIRYRDMIDKVVLTKCKHIRKNVKIHYKKRPNITFEKDANCVCSEFYEMKK